MALATVSDVILYGKDVDSTETEKVTELIAAVTSQLRIIAKSVGKDLDDMCYDDEDYAELVKSIIVAVVIRYMNQNIDSEAMSQVTQSAGGYSATGTYLVPGGGIFIKNAELKLLGLRRQKVGVIEFYGDD